MSMVTGQVKAISQRGNAFNIRVDDDWYGYGFNKPAFNKGDTISFDFQQRGNFKNVDAKTVQVGASAPAQQAAPASGGSAPAKSGRDFGANQVAIQYQASRNSAIALVSAALAAGEVTLPTKKGDRLDALLALVDDLTDQYHAKTDQVVKAGGVILEGMEQAVVTDDGEEVPF